MVLPSIYTFTIVISIFIVFYDYALGGSYSHTQNYNRLVLAGMLEPVFYHPLVTLCAIRGYFNYLIGTTAVWGEMTRTGVKKKADELEDQSHTDIIKDKIEEHGDTHEIKGGWGDRMNV